MIFDNVIEQIQAEEKNTEVVIVKLGEVSSVTPGGRAYVKLYGDGAPSTKLYTYIDGYFPEVGDKVALLPQGKTYIILGKVNEKDPVELYAKIKWVEENFCPIEYKSIIEDASNPAEDITFGNYALLPTTDNKDTLGSAAKNFKEIFIKKLTLDGESFTKIYKDRIFVVNGNTTYSLIATYAAGTITLTPSTNDSWALGTSAAKLKEIWTGLFRGAWKSGQSTERELSWNASNALVPDSNEAVDLGSSSLHFKDLYIRRVIGAIAHDSTNGYISWTSATVLAPSATDSIELGAAAKQFNKVYTKSLYLNGTEFIPANITVDKLHTTYGGASKDLTLSADSSGVHLVPSATNALSLGTSAKQYNKAYVKELYLNGTKFDPSGEVTTNKLVDDTGGYSRTLTMTASSSGATILPGDNNAYELGGSSAKFSKVYATEFNGDLLGELKDGTYRLGFDNNHSFYPNTNNAISLGASSYQFNKTYTKELYLNGTKFDPNDLVLSKLTATYGTGVRTLTLSAESSATYLLPSSNGTFSIGNTNYTLKDVYAQRFIGIWARTSATPRYLYWDSYDVLPATNNETCLGSSTKQFKAVYGQNLYVNGTAVSSDRNKKEDIEPLNEKHIEFFKALKPVTYKFKDGNSGRHHTGFIAQDVEQAVEDAGLTDKDMAVVVKDPEDNYYLRYEEIIAVQTKIIQELMEKAESQDAKIRNLESRLAKIEKYIFTGGETK